MSISALARELYRAQQRVTSLEQQSRLEGADHAHLQRELALARKEAGMLRKMLDARKDDGTRKRTFG